VLIAKRQALDRRAMALAVRQHAIAIASSGRRAINAASSLSPRRYVAVTADDFSRLH
jgi:hypothetical protein